MEKGLFSESFLAGVTRATFWTMVDEFGVGPYEEVICSRVGEGRFFVERRFAPSRASTDTDR